MSQVDQAHRWPCPSCGSDLRYAPGTAQLVCDHCAATREIPPPKARDRDIALAEIDLARGLNDDLPAQAAWTLAQGWAKCDLRLIPLAGHALSEPAISEALVATMNGLRSAFPR